ncbi:bifunctional DNA-binding transcriptional regulator/O6-methylguanine-DNA methyltransferase Ada [Hoeflea sp. CAU 1731]
MLDLTTPMKNNPSIDNDDACWEAVLNRDQSADGRFVYAVVTTGVFCRPSCPSRKGLRKNVRYYEDPAEALKNGFRPCKRCDPLSLAVNRKQDAIEAACRLIEESVEIPDLDDLAREAGMSKFHFHRKFKAATGITPKAYAAATRAERMRGNLASGASVTEAIYDAGYNASSRFYDEAANRLGMQPRQFRDGGRDAEIRFAVGECSLGSILVAATDKGVCSIEFADDPEILVTRLQDRFGKARLVGADKDFEELVARIVGHVERPEGSLDLPLDIRGTAFQEKVWAALRAIPAGATASYADIAATIGQPGAQRAVGAACRSNPVAMAIPCHRVVRTDGRISGYRWGIERKEALLTREYALAAE